MFRTLVFTGLVVAGSMGMATSAAQAALLPANGAVAGGASAVFPARYEDPGYRYGYNSYQGYQPYYYYPPRGHQYRYYRQYQGYDDYYYRPHRPHRFWWRW